MALSHSTSHLTSHLALLQVLEQALVYEAPQGCLKLISKLTDLDRKRLEVAQHQVDSMQKARAEQQKPLYYCDEERGGPPYPEEWADFVSMGWKLHSRKSENKRDEVRSPLKDPATSKRSQEHRRIHWFTKGQKELLQALLALGKVKF